MKEIVKKWIRKSDHDFRNIELIIEEDLYDLVCFHGQQCIEKLLKAYLIHNDKNIDKTHDLLKLLSECSSLDTSFDSLKKQCSQLNDFAVDARYPGEDIEQDEAQTAYKITQELREFILGKIQ
ncbi:MAG: HEPN domain-containing protein [Candidatus Melainabacteria bacterium]|jgi:HEPN domain-containing protein|nr:HEPN domain-containing protein [Candidatus Melainabacteria bacterium]